MTAANGRPARGFLVPIGGAEDKDGDAVILREFLRLCGGSSARIVIIPTASRLRDTGQRYQQLFHRLGAKDATVLRFRLPGATEDPGMLEALADADGVFLTGGNQSRLVRILRDTPVERLLHELRRRGVHIAGTSAGAAVMSRYMIDSGQSGSTPRRSMVNISEGLGLADGIIVDQHFRERDRLGRLVAALSYHPTLIGLGVDEDTAAFIHPGGTLEVQGSGSVTVVDPDTSIFDPRSDHDPIDTEDVHVHVLSRGETYNVETRTAGHLLSHARRGDVLQLLNRLVDAGWRPGQNLPDQPEVSRSPPTPR